MLLCLLLFLRRWKRSTDNRVPVVLAACSEGFYDVSALVCLVSVIGEAGLEGACVPLAWLLVSRGHARLSRKTAAIADFLVSCRVALRSAYTVLHSDSLASFGAQKY